MKSPSRDRTEVTARSGRAVYRYVVPEGGTVFMDRFGRGIVSMHPSNPPVLFRFADGQEEALSAAEATEAIAPNVYSPAGDKP